MEITKEQAIEYFSNHKEDLWDLCEKFNLRFPYEDRENLMYIYNNLKRVLDILSKDPNCTEQYDNVLEKLEQMEKTYHIFQPEFDKKSEARWIPKEYNSKAKEIFKFRKSMFKTQNIYADYELTNIISQDMGDIWDEKGGQDGMYDAFPFTFTRRSIVRESDYYSDYLKTNEHIKIEMIRSYVLDSHGGIVIVERREYVHFDDMTNIRPEAQDSYNSRFMILTLGEDDAYHFLNSANIYEDIYSCTSDNFNYLLSKVIEEYNKNKS